MRVLIFGRGFVGQRCAEAWGEDATLSDVRVGNAEDAAREIERVRPDAVLNAAGVTGKPNVDWCDAHPLETIVGNTLVPIAIAQACQRAGTYLLHVGSGCIFYDDAPHPDKRWREDDHGNPLPAYSRSKWAADLALSTLPNVGIARIRMPLDSKPGPRNSIDKIAGYTRVIDVANSVTVVDDMIPVFWQLMERRAPGIFHVVNPGVLRHRELIALYEELVDPTHTNEWITADELVSTGLATKRRSNNVMSSDRLLALGIEMREVHEALRDTLEKYAEARRGND